MGLSLSWVGVEARHRVNVLGWFGLEPAGEGADEFGSDFSLAETPQGWLVLVANGHGFDLDEALGGVSAACGFAVGAVISEAASFSQASAFQNGARAWSVTCSEDNPGDGLSVGGKPPAEFAAIRERAEARESASSALDAPVDLAASIVGYRPGERAGLQWTRLRKRGRRPAPRPAPTSLRARIVAELLPSLRALGWRWGERPDLSVPRQICRDLKGASQTLWFEYASGEETYIIVHFGVVGPSAEREWLTGGHIAYGESRPPLRSRFSWKRFIELTRGPPEPEDLVGSVLERARTDILQADDYLRTGEAGPRIRIDFQRPSDLWPPRASATI